MAELLLRPLSDRRTCMPWDVIRVVDGEEYYTSVEIPDRSGNGKTLLGVGDFVRVVPRDRSQTGVSAVGQVCSIYQRRSKEVLITYVPKNLLNLTCEVRLLVRPGDAATGAWVQKALSGTRSFFRMPARKPYHGDAELVALAGAFLECPVGKWGEESSDSKSNPVVLELGKVSVESADTFMRRSSFTDSTFYCREKEVMFSVDNPDGTVSMNSRIVPISTGGDESEDETSIAETLFAVSMSPRNAVLYGKSVSGEDSGSSSQKRKNEEQDAEDERVAKKRRNVVIDDDDDDNNDDNDSSKGNGEEECERVKDSSESNDLNALDDDDEDIFEDVVSGELCVDRKDPSGSNEDEEKPVGRQESQDFPLKSDSSVLTIPSSSPSLSPPDSPKKGSEEKEEPGENKMEKYISQLGPVISASSEKPRTPKTQKKISRLVPLKVESPQGPQGPQKQAFESPSSLWKKMSPIRQSRIGMFFQKMDQPKPTENLVAKFNKADKTVKALPQPSTRRSALSTDASQRTESLEYEDDRDLDDFIVGDDDAIEYYEKSKNSLDGESSSGGSESGEEEKEKKKVEDEENSSGEQERKKGKRKKRLNSAVLSDDDDEDDYEGVNNGSEDNGDGSPNISISAPRPNVLCSPGRVHQLFTLRQAFSVYVQFLASACLDPDFVSSTNNKKGREYFGAACQKVERELLTKKECLVSSSVWKLGLFRDIKSRPVFVSYPRASASDHDCDACSRVGQGSMYIVKFRGKPYDSDALWANETIYEIDPEEIYDKDAKVTHGDGDNDSDQDDEQCEVDSDSDDSDSINKDDFDTEEAAWRAKRKNFYVLGKTCHMKTKLYHTLHHYKLSLIASIKKKLSVIKENGYKDNGNILTALLDDASWCSSVKNKQHFQTTFLCYFIRFL